MALHTILPLAANEVHALGQAAVAELQAQMAYDGSATTPRRSAYRFVAQRPSSPAARPIDYVR